MKKETSPFSVLIAFAEGGKSENLISLLETFGEKNAITLMGKGTAESEVADLFGFGILPREIVLCIIKKENAKKIVEEISKQMNFEDVKHEGLAFTIPLNAIEKEYYNFLKTNFGGKNE